MILTHYHVLKFNIHKKVPLDPKAYGVRPELLPCPFRFFVTNAADLVLLRTTISRPAQAVAGVASRLDGSKFSLGCLHKLK